MPTICNINVAVFKNNLAIDARLLNFQQVESIVGIFKFGKDFIQKLIKLQISVQNLTTMAQTRRGLPPSGCRVGHFP